MVQSRCHAAPTWIQGFGGHPRVTDGAPREVSPQGEAMADAPARDLVVPVPVPISPLGEPNDRERRYSVNL